MTKTEQQICDALILLMQEKPFSKIKVTEITAKANVSRSTFYSYFDSIFEVLQTLEDDFSSHIVDEKEVGLYHDAEAVERNFSYIRNHLTEFEALTGTNGDPAFLARLGNRSKRILLTIADDASSSLTDTQLAIVNEFARAGKLQVFHWWAEHSNDVSVNEIIDMLDQITSAIHRIVIKNK